MGLAEKWREAMRPRIDKWRFAPLRVCGPCTTDTRLTLGIGCSVWHVVSTSKLQSTTTGMVYSSPELVAGWRRTNERRLVRLNWRLRFERRWLDNGGKLT